MTKSWVLGKTEASVLTEGKGHLERKQDTLLVLMWHCVLDRVK